jgi:hypothetical protein
MSIMDSEEIQSVLDFHLPRKLALSVMAHAGQLTPKEIQAELDELWNEERETAINRCVTVIARRIKEREDNV